MGVSLATGDETQNSLGVIMIVNNHLADELISLISQLIRQCLAGALGVWRLSFKISKGKVSF